MKRNLLFSLLLLSTLAFPAGTSKDAWQSVQESLHQTAHDLRALSKDVIAYASPYAAQARRKASDMAASVKNTLENNEFISKDQMQSLLTHAANAGQKALDTTLLVTYYVPVAPAFIAHLIRANSIAKHNRKALKDPCVGIKKLNPIVTLAVYAASIPAVYYFSHHYLQARKIEHNKHLFPVTPCECTKN